MAYRKQPKNSDKLLVEHRNSGQILQPGATSPTHHNFFNRRVLTETVEHDDEFEIERTMKKYGFNFRSGRLPDVEEEKPQPAKGGKHCSNSKEKRNSNVFATSKDRRRNLVTSAKNLNFGLYVPAENRKKKEPQARILMTECSANNAASFKQTHVRSKEKLIKKNKLPVSKPAVKIRKSPNPRDEFRERAKQQRSNFISDSLLNEKATKTQTTETDKDFDSPQIDILEKVGQGTFGQVYMARMNGQLVAIKKVFQDKKYKNRELEILKLLDNDFVLKVLMTFYTSEQSEQGEQKEYLNVVMEYYQQNLYELVSENKRVPDLETKIYVYEMFRGLAYCHSLDICHRDIKPPNILVHRQNKKLVICDFGSAKKLVRGEPNIAYICSRCYRAPELIFGCTTYTTMIDIWSAGCVLLEMLKGQPFFVGESNLDQLVEIIKIMGTPSKTQVINMNPSYDLDDYKFPKIKQKDWRTIFPKAEDTLISFLRQIMIYSPKERLNACEALAHQYFDELRDPQVYRQMQQKWSIPNLFDFTKEELRGNEHLAPRLVPQWYKRISKPIKL